MTTSHRTARPVFAAFILAGSTLSVSAQLDAFDAQTPPDAAPESDVLRGPEAPKDARPDRRASFGDAAERPGASGLQFGAVLREIRALRGQNVPESARLSEDQSREIMGIARAYQQDRRAFMEMHAEEFDELRAVLGELAPDRAERSRQARQPRTDAPDQARRQRAGQRDAAPDRTMDDDRRERNERPQRARSAQTDRAAPDRPARAEPTPEQGEALKQWREIMKEGPDSQAALATVMDVLTPEQRTILGDNLKRRADERAAGQRERRAESDSTERPEREDRRRSRRAPGMESVDVPDPDAP